VYIIFLAILIIFFLVPTADALREKKKPKNDAVITEKMWLKEKYQSIAFLWGGALAVFIMCSIAGIRLEDIGFRPMSFSHTWVAVVTLVLFGSVAAFLLYQTILPLVSAKHRAEAKKQITADEVMMRVLPRSKKEKRAFALLSFSAGFCEEILYRGFFVFLLQAIFPGIPIYLIVLIPTVLFGISHFYEGVQGVIRTGATGAMLMCLFLVSDSLILCMVIHFLMDFASTFLLSDEQGKKSLLDFAGILSKEDGASILEATKDAERVDDEW
jgi:membrane protease YdiL (CAAX protease family)